ncbi:MAG: hypothetical protein WCK82_04060 [Bacteroidota bacterium]
MVLLFNVFITNKSATGGQWERLGVTYDRGNLDTPNKLEILKYSLASYAVAYPWKRVILNLELDPDYISLDKQQELKEFCTQIFKGKELFYSDRRNVHQQDWIKTYDLINDDVIFYQCNHDHIFIDSSTSYLEELVSLREKYGENLTISTSHFPEAIRTAKGCYIDLFKGETQPSQFTSDYKLNNNHIFRTTQVFDSLIIITKEIYKNWFLEGDWSQIQCPPRLFKSGKLELARTEGTGVIGLAGIKDLIKSPLIKQVLITPYKEIFRHFDGYYHQYITNNQCPAVSIPPGFFENNIKIRYGYDDYLEGWVNVNPKNPNYYAYDKSGVDYKFTLNEIPLFWKNRISIIDSNSNINEEEMIQYRLKSVLEMIYTHPYYEPYIDKELEIKILNKYLEQYPNYEYQN